MGWIGTIRKSTPVRRVSSAASDLEWSLENKLGIEIAVTLPAPSASAASTVTTAESMPPDNATTADSNPFLRA